MRLGTYCRQNKISSGQFMKEAARLGFTDIDEHPNSKIPNALLSMLLATKESFEGVSDRPNMNDRTDANFNSEPTLNETHETNQKSFASSKFEPVNSMITAVEAIKPVVPILTGPRIIGKIDIPERVPREIKRKVEKIALKEYELKVKPHQAGHSKGLPKGEVVFSDELRKRQIQTEIARRKHEKEVRKDRARQKHSESVKSRNTDTYTKSTSPKRKIAETVKTDVQIARPKDWLSRIMEWLFKAE